MGWEGMEAYGLRPFGLSGLTFGSDASNAGVDDGVSAHYGGRGQRIEEERVGVVQRTEDMVRGKKEKRADEERRVQPPPMMMSKQLKSRLRAAPLPAPALKSGENGDIDEIPRKFVTISFILSLLGLDRGIGPSLTTCRIKCFVCVQKRNGSSMKPFFASMLL